MTDTAKKTDPKLWAKVKTKVQNSDKGGKPGQWSARKAQLAVHDYKEAGGGYAGPKSADNHLAQWTREEWGTKSGSDSQATGERYLPEKAREALSDEEYRQTSDKKRADTSRGKQFSKQPAAAAAKTAKARLETLTVEALRKRAAAAGIKGRSTLDKAGLVKALSSAG